MRYFDTLLYSGRPSAAALRLETLPIFYEQSVVTQATRSVTAADQWSAALLVQGLSPASRALHYSVTGTWSGTITLQESADGVSGWSDVDSMTVNEEHRFDDGRAGDYFYRIGSKAGEFSSGSAAVRVSTMPTQSDLNSRLASVAAYTDVVCFDVETWLDYSTPVAAARTAELYVELSQRIRVACPNALIGHYSVPPQRDYWNAIGLTTAPGFETWQAINSALRPIMAHCDVMFPSLYTFYDDPPGWLLYAERNIEEARRVSLGKPVYPFLWPQYHDSNVSLAGTNIPADDWTAQLDLLREQANGLVIWGGFSIPWDRGAAWWAATQEHLGPLRVVHR